MLTLIQFSLILIKLIENKFWHAVGAPMCRASCANTNYTVSAG